MNEVSLRARLSVSARESSREKPEPQRGRKMYRAERAILQRGKDLVTSPVFEVSAEGRRLRWRERSREEEEESERECVLFEVLA